MSIFLPASFKDWLTSLTEQVLDDDFCLSIKLTERVPARLSGRYWMWVDPAATSELIEVITRIDRVVHGVQNVAGSLYTSLRCTQSVYKQMLQAFFLHFWTIGTDLISLLILLLLFFLLVFSLGRTLQKSQRLRRFKSDRGEIWQNCSSSKYTSIDNVTFLT